MSQGIQIKILTAEDPEFSARIPALARLRITVFREFPYLYGGSLEYEEKYLSTYRDCKESVVALALDGDEVIGASTALPLAAESAQVTRAFEQQPYPLNEIFYCGESILLPSYRGRGIYREFFAAREQHARKLGGFRWITLCAVVRASDHPRRPRDFVPLNAIWRKFGYTQYSELRTTFEWQDLDEAGGHG